MSVPGEKHDETVVAMRRQNPASSAETQQAITRAKQDWESTADALSHIVCLLDENRRVLRVNRVIESWKLGRVNEVINRDLHDLLHPEPCTGDCKLRERILEGWARVREGSLAEFELLDLHLNRALSVALRPIGSGPSVATPTGNPSAVVVITDVTPLHAARAALEGLNEGLEIRVHERTRELESANSNLQTEILRRQSAEEALRDSRNELELLSQQLIKAQESERRRIAQELHDSIGQSMSAIKYSLERAAELQRKAKSAECEHLILRTIERVRETIGEIRSIAMGLRPSVLDDLGVASALEWLCREFAETYTHIAVHTCMSAADADVPERLRTTIFRCAQELLNNVAKHARAHHVSIALIRGEHTITLRICDDGAGLPAASASGSYGIGHGIRNLRERAQMTGGVLSLLPGQTSGTRAQVEWMLQPARPPTAGS